MSQSSFKTLWDFLSLVGGEVIGKIAGLVAFAYLAHTLDPTAYGSIEFAVTLMTFFSMLIDFGYGSVGAREIAHRRENTERYATAIPAARLLLTFMSIVLMSAAGYWFARSREGVTLVFIFTLALLAAPWNQRWLFQGLDRMHLVSLGQLMRMLIFAVGVILLVRNTTDLYWVGYAEAGASLAMALYFIVMQLRYGVSIRLNFDFGFLWRLTRQSLSIGLSQAVWALNQYLPTFLVVALVTITEVAWFGAAHRIVISLVTFSMLYHFNLFPLLTRKLANPEAALSDVVQPSFRVTAWGGIFFALCITVYAGPICVFVFGDQFQAAAIPMAVLIWMLPITLLSGHARWLLIAGHRQRCVLIAQSLSTLGTVIACVILIPLYGATGASISMVVASLVVWLVAHYYAVQWMGRMPFIANIFRPVLLAAIVLAVVIGIDALPWYGHLLLLCLFALSAPIVDRSFLPDLKKILTVKADSNAVRGNEEGEMV